MYKYLAVWLAIIVYSATSAAYGKEREVLEVKISVNQIFLEKYQKWLDGQTCDKIQSYDSPYANRVSVELMLICQAFYLSGVEPKLNLSGHTHFARTAKSIQRGTLDMAAQSRWLDSLDVDLYYISEPIVRRGEFIKGIFTRATHRELLAVSSLQALKKFTVLSSHKWSVDWKTIGNLGLPRMDSQGNQTQMYPMIARGRADYILGEFRSSQSFKNTFNNVELVAVPNIAVVLDSSRHFVVSKAAKNGKRIFTQLEQGIRKLRAQGTIVRAYTESGFYNQIARSWKKIN